MNRRRVALLLIIVFLLVLALLAITYFLSSLLTPPGTQTIEAEQGESGLSMLWVRSIYGMGATDSQSLDDPVDMAVADGLIYVAQPTRAAVWVFDTDGSPVRSITSDQFKLPNAVETGPGGRIFVADKGHDLVFCLDDDGAVLWMKNVVRVSDMTWAGDRLYVAAFDRIQVFDIDGEQLFEWGERGFGQGQFDFPRGVLVRSDDIVVADGNNSRLQAFDSTGTFLWETGMSYRDPASEDTSETALFQVPGGLCAGPDGRMLVADALNFDIVALEADGTLVGRVGSEGSADGKFWYPSSICALGDDRYVIADTMNDRLQIVEITFDGAGAIAGARSFLSGLGGAWCICPTALLILVIVAVAVWVLSGRRDNGPTDPDSGLDVESADADRQDEDR